MREIHVVVIVVNPLGSKDADSLPVTLEEDRKFEKLSWDFLLN